METTAQLLDAGLTVTLIGMTVVFILLTALVGVVSAMSALCQRFFPEPPPVERVSEDDELIGVITAAINHYRRSRAA
jgi:sodium pump decarboxylase gamma subunit